jgi:signal peptidase II
MVVIIDQVVKLSVKLTMQPYEEVKVLGDFFRINYIENKGAAFGLTIRDLMARVGVSMSDETAKLSLTMFSILAVIVILYLLQRVRDSRTSLPYFLALILGGAIGNIVDRAFYGVWFSGINDYEGGLLHGRVVDMFYFDLVHGNVLGLEMNLLPVFNLADSAITVGIIAIVFFQRRFFRNTREESGNLVDSVAGDSALVAGSMDEVPGGTGHELRPLKAPKRPKS